MPHVHPGLPLQDPAPAPGRGNASQSLLGQPQSGDAHHTNRTEKFRAPCSDGRQLSIVQGAFDCLATDFSGVHVDHRGLEVSVSEHLLDAFHAYARLDQVSREGMAQHVDSGGLAELGALDGPAKFLLQRCNVDVVAHRFAVLASGDALGGEQVAPSDFAASALVFDRDRVWQIDTDIVRNIGLVERCDAGDMLLEWRDQFSG